MRSAEFKFLPVSPLARIAADRLEGFVHAMRAKPMLRSLRCSISLFVNRTDALFLVLLLLLLPEDAVELEAAVAFCL